MNRDLVRWLSIGSVVFSVCLGSQKSHASVNVAPHLGIATQSTTGFGGDAARAIDGNTSGVFGENSVSHTNTGDPTPWWEVDLGEEFEIETVVIWNRTDCCSTRLTNFAVSVLDADRSETFSEEFFVDGIGFPDPNLEIEVGAEGSIVRVEVFDSHAGFDPAEYFLSMAEVEVFVNVDDLAPLITAQPQGGRAAVGGSFTFTVEAIGAEPLSFQWEKDEVAIDGATESSLVLANLTFEDEGEYSVVVSNAVDSLTSELATLRVTPPNVALCGVATQSTTGFGGVAARAIDGNTDGNYGNGSVTHTNGDVEAWWEVTLSENASIESVVLWNRTDCCQGRLSNLTVSILNNTRDEVWSDEFFSDGIPPDTPDFEIEVGGVEGRFVRIQKGPEAAEPWMSLAEVEIFAEGPCVVPLDRDLTGRDGVVASQSSQHGDFGPARGIDDNFGNFTHTLAGTNLPATWEVDLNGEFEIAELVLYNRPDCCGSRLRDVTVFILDSSGPEENVLWESELLNPENELGVFPNGPPELRLDLVELNGGPVAGGRVLRVVRTPDEDLSGSDGQGDSNEATVLSLGEVEVFELPDCPAEGDDDYADTHCSGIAIEGPDDGSPGSYTVTAGATDDSGDIVQYTFTAVHRAFGTTLIRGPQADRSAALPLRFGTWDLSVTVDDDELCADEAQDATCTEVVEVIDPACVEGEVCNVAIRGRASQSTTGFGLTADLAIDGNTDGNAGSVSLTHTNVGDPSPAWEVELDQDYSIETIVLWNRTDCCPQRLTNFTVTIFDADHEEVYSAEFFADGAGFPDTAVEGFEIPIEGEEGRFVEVKLLNTHPGFNPDEFFLSLAEVQIFAVPGPTGANLRPGDVNGDGVHNISDPVALLDFLFSGGTIPLCYRILDSAELTDAGNGILDFNGDGKSDISDAVGSLEFLFGGGPAHVLGQDCVQLTGTCESKCQ